MLTIFHGSEARDRDTLIQDVAQDVARALRMDLSPAVANMCVAELRGYLRSRALCEAQTQVRRSAAEVRLSPEGERELIAAVLERAVHLVIRDLMVCPVVSIPTPHVETRAA